VESSLASLLWKWLIILYYIGFFFTYAVLAEWKPPVYDNTRGIVLVTATTRRNSPNVSFCFVYLLSWFSFILHIGEHFDTFCFYQNLDSKIHHNNLLNNILAKVFSCSSQPKCAN